MRCDLVPDLGRVGTPTLVDVSVVAALLSNRFTPVISPISLGPDGEAVNVNADEVACALAVALRAERLLLLSDVDGVLVQGESSPEVAVEEVESLVASGQITGGMIPKLRAAATAAGEVGEVRVGTFDGRPLVDIAGTRIRGRRGTDAGPVAEGETPRRKRCLPAVESQVLAGVFQYPRLVLSRGEGSYVWDVDGRRYLDFTAGLESRPSATAGAIWRRHLASSSRSLDTAPICLEICRRSSWPRACAIRRSRPDLVRQ